MKLIDVRITKSVSEELSPKLIRQNRRLSPAKFFTLELIFQHEGAIPW